MIELRPVDPTKAPLALFPVPGHMGPYTVGRKETHLLIENDKSVSRSHATIEYGPDGLTLTHVGGSNSGTYINDNPAKIPTNEPHKLRPGDRVRFGGQCRYTVAERKLKFCASTLATSEKDELTRAAGALGAAVVSNWADDVTHLVMPKVSFTPKLLSAMANIKPVITMQWVRLAMQRTVLSQPLPDSSEPSVVPQQDSAQAPGAGKQSMPTLAAMPQPERAKLFTGRHFVVLPGGKPIQNTANEELLQKMGATLHRWPAGASAEFANEQVAAGVRDFLLPEGLAAASASQASQRGETPLPPEAYWAARAGGAVAGAESVRLCLLYTTASKLSSLEILLGEEAAAPDLEQEQPLEEPSQPVATQQAARPPSLSQAPPKLPPRRQQAPPPESEEPTQVEAPASGRKRREAAPPVESTSKRGRSTARADAAAAAEAADPDPEPEPEPAAAVKPLAAAEKEDDDVRREELPSAAVGDEEEMEVATDANQSSVVETDVCAPPRPVPPRVSEPAPDGWRKRGAGTLHHVEDMPTMREAPPVQVIRRSPSRPAAPAARRSVAGAEAPPPPNGKKRFVKQRINKHAGAPVCLTKAVVATGKDKEDLEQRKQDREAADVDDEDEDDPLEFDSKLASNRGGGKAATARKRTTRR